MRSTSSRGSSSRPIPSARETSPVVGARSSAPPGNRTSGRPDGSSRDQLRGRRIVPAPRIAPGERQPVAPRELEHLHGGLRRTRTHHLDAEPPNALQQLPPRDEAGQQQIAQRPILEQEPPQRVAVDRDVAQRLRNHRAHKDGLAGQQVELAEETPRAVADDLVARLVENRHLALNDRDEGVPLIADLVQHLADIRRALVAELGKRRQLRGGQPRTCGTWHETSLPQLRRRRQLKRLGVQFRCAADLHEHHHHVAARAAARDGTGCSCVNRELRDQRLCSAVRAAPGDSGHLGAEVLEQPSGDRVAVESIHPDQALPMSCVRNIHCCSSSFRTTSTRTSCVATSISPSRSIRVRASSLTFAIRSVSSRTAVWSSIDARATGPISEPPAAACACPSGTWPSATARSATTSESSRHESTSSSSCKWSDLKSGPTTAQCSCFPTSDRMTRSCSVASSS